MSGEELPEEVHILASGTSPFHVENAGCWCGPERVAGDVYLHRDRGGMVPDPYEE